MIEEKLLSLKVTTAATLRFRNEYIKRSFNTSGQSYDSIQQDNNKISGRLSIFTLIYGRKPGTFAPWGFGKDGRPTELMKWVKEKIVNNDKEAKSVSFLVSRKLKERGNRIFEKKEKPLDTKETINEANKVMFDEVYRSYLKDFNIK
jgi:hypothetical protein